MTKIDPYTGVPVLTFPEFMGRMAEASGRTVEEEYEDLHAGIDREIRKEERDWEENALARMTEKVRAYNKMIGSYNEGLPEEDREPAVPEPVEVEVPFRSITITGGFGPFGERIEAYATRPDGTQGVLVHAYDYIPGTYVDPPEEEFEVWWEDPETGEHLNP